MDKAIRCWPMALVLAALGGGFAPYAKANATLDATAPPLTIIAPAPASETTDISSHLPIIEGENRTAVSIAAVLARHPAVLPQVGNDETGGRLPIFRGQSGEKSRFRLGWVPLTDAQFNSSPIQDIPLSSLDGLRVFAGSVPSSWGQDGTASGVELAFPRQPRRSEFFVTAGSWGNLAATGRSAAPRFGVQEITVSAARGDDNFRYRDDNGTPLQPSDDSWKTRENNGFWRVSLLPRFRFQLAKRHWDAFFWGAWFGKSLPGSVQKLGAGELTRNHQVVAAQTEAPIEGGSFHQSAYTRSEESLVLSDSSSGLFIAPGRSLGQAIWWRSGWKGSVGKGWRLNASAGAGWESYDRNRETHLRWQIPLSMEWQKRGENWLLQPSLLTHWYQYGSSGGQQTSSDYWLPSLQLRGQRDVAPGWKLEAGAGNLYRAPTLVERFGGGSGLVANSQLKPERAWKCDAGLAFRHSAIQASLQASWALMRDEIVLVQTSQASATSQNLSATQTWSAELNLAVPISSQFTLVASGTFLRAENQSPETIYAGKVVPGRPNWMGRLALQWESAQWFAGYEISARSDAYADVYNTRKREGYSLHSLRAGWASPNWGTWQVAVDNLFDVNTVAAASGNYLWQEQASGSSGYPAPGRKLSLTWSISL